MCDNAWRTMIWMIERKMNSFKKAEMCARSANWWSQVGFGVYSFFACHCSSDLCMTSKMERNITMCPIWLNQSLLNAEISWCEKCYANFVIQKRLSQIACIQSENQKSKTECFYCQLPWVRMKISDGNDPSWLLYWPFPEKCHKFYKSYADLISMNWVIMKIQVLL